MPISKAAPKMEPTTIPAIFPPERPWCFDRGAAPEVLFAEELLDVGDGNSRGTGKIDGNVTCWHRLVTFEVTQQESVAFGELNAQ